MPCASAGGCCAWRCSTCAPRPAPSMPLVNGRPGRALVPCGCARGPAGSMRGRGARERPRRRRNARACAGWAAACLQSADPGEQAQNARAVGGVVARRQLVMFGWPRAEVGVRRQQEVMLAPRTDWAHLAVLEQRCALARGPVAPGPLLEPAGSCETPTGCGGGGGGGGGGGVGEGFAWAQRCCCWRRRLFGWCEGALSGADGVRAGTRTVGAGRACELGCLLPAAVRPEAAEGACRCWGEQLRPATGPVASAAVARGLVRAGKHEWLRFLSFFHGRQAGRPEPLRGRSRPVRVDADPPPPPHPPPPAPALCAGPSQRRASSSVICLARCGLSLPEADPPARAVRGRGRVQDGAPPDQRACGPLMR